MRIRVFCLFLFAASLATSDSNFPAMNYKVDAGWPQLPAGWNFGETPGVWRSTLKATFSFSTAASIRLSSSRRKARW